MADRWMSRQSASGRRINPGAGFRIPIFFALSAVWARGLWRNEANRRILYILFCTSAAVPVFRAVAAIAGLSIHQSLVVELILFAFGSACIAINSYRGVFLVAGIFAAGALLSSFMIEQVLRITAGIDLLAGLAIAYLWGRAPPGD